MALAAIVTAAAVSAIPVGVLAFLGSTDEPNNRRPTVTRLAAPDDDGAADAVRELKAKDNIQEQQHMQQQQQQHHEPQQNLHHVCSAGVVSTIANNTRGAGSLATGFSFIGDTVGGGNNSGGDPYRQAPAEHDERVPDGTYTNPYTGQTYACFRDADPAPDSTEPLHPADNGRALAYLHAAGKNGHLDGTRDRADAYELGDPRESNPDPHPSVAIRNGMSRGAAERGARDHARLGPVRLNMSKPEGTGLLAEEEQFAANHDGFVTRDVAAIRRTIAAHAPGDRSLNARADFLRSGVGADAAQSHPAQRSESFLGNRNTKSGAYGRAPGSQGGLGVHRHPMGRRQDANGLAGRRGGLQLSHETAGRAPSGAGWFEPGPRGSRGRSSIGAALPMPKPAGRDGIASAPRAPPARPTALESAAAGRSKAGLMTGLEGADARGRGAAGWRVQGRAAANPSRRGPAANSRAPFASVGGASDTRSAKYEARRSSRQIATTRAGAPERAAQAGEGAEARNRRADALGRGQRGRLAAATSGLGRQQRERGTSATDPRAAAAQPSGRSRGIAPADGNALRRQGRVELGKNNNRAPVAARGGIHAAALPWTVVSGSARRPLQAADAPLSGRERALGREGDQIPAPPAKTGAVAAGDKGGWAAERAVPRQRLGVTEPRNQLPVGVSGGQTWGHDSGANANTGTDRSGALAGGRLFDPSRGGGPGRPSGAAEDNRRPPSPSVGGGLGRKGRPNPREGSGSAAPVQSGDAPRRWYADRFKKALGAANARAQMPKQILAGDVYTPDFDTPLPLSRPEGANKEWLAPRSEQNYTRNRLKLEQDSKEMI